MNEQKQAAIRLQQLFCDTYWRCFPMDLKKEHKYIKLFIGFSFFDLPQIAGDGQNFSLENCINYYSDEQKSVIESSYGLLSSLSTSKRTVYLKNTYLVTLSDEPAGNVNVSKFPIAPLLAFSFKGNHSYQFIDSLCRVYENWEDFLNNNRLPSSEYCFPENGIYTPRCEVVFGSKKTAVVGNIINAGTGVASIGSVAILSAVSAPVVLSVAACVGVGAACYQVGRSIRQLVDRSTHRQSILPSNREAALAWLNIGSSALSGIQLGAAMYMPTIVRNFGVNSVEILTYSAVAIDSAAVTFAVCNMIDNYLQGKGINYQDLANLCVQIFFLTGAVVTARQLHNELSNRNVGVVKKLTSSLKCSLQGQRQEVTFNRDIAVTHYTVDTRSQIFNTITEHLPSVAGALFTELGGVRIVRWFQAIYRTWDDFQQNRISKASFLSHCMQHLFNLRKILMDDLEHLRNQFKPFIQTDRDITETGILLENFVLEVENLEATFLERTENYKMGILRAIPTTPLTSFELRDAINRPCAFGTNGTQKNTAKIKEFEKVLNKANRLFLESDWCGPCDELSMRKVDIFRVSVGGLILNTRDQMNNLISNHLQIYGESVDVLGETLTNTLWNERLNKMYTESLNKALETYSSYADSRLEYRTVKKMEPKCIKQYFDSLIETFVSTFMKVVNCSVSYIAFFDILHKVWNCVVNRVITLGSSLWHCVVNRVITLGSYYPPRPDQIDISKIAADIRWSLLDSRKYSDFDYRIERGTGRLISENQLLQIVASRSGNESSSSTKILDIVSRLMITGKRNGMLNLTTDNVLTVFKHMILFIKSKVVSEMRKLIDQMEKTGKKQQLIIPVFNMIEGKCESGLLSEFASYFVIERSLPVSELPLWKDITNFDGIYCYKYFNEDITSNREYIENMFKIDMASTRGNTEGNLLVVTPNSCNKTFQLLIFWKEQDSSKGGMAVCYKSVTAL